MVTPEVNYTSANDLAGAAHQSCTMQKVAHWC